MRKPGVDIPRGADEREVGEGLREVPQVFAVRAELFAVKAEGIGVPSIFS